MVELPAHLGGPHAPARQASSCPLGTTRVTGGGPSLSNVACVPWAPVCGARLEAPEEALEQSSVPGVPMRCRRTGARLPPSDTTCATCAVCFRTPGMQALSAPSAGRSAPGRATCTAWGSWLQPPRASRAAQGRLTPRPGQHQRAVRAGLINMELQDRGAGWIAHPAVTDNAIQMGPMTGVVEALTAPPGTKVDSATRVVGGLAAYRAQVSTLLRPGALETAGAVHDRRCRGPPCATWRASWLCPAAAPGLAAFRTALWDQPLPGYSISRCQGGCCSSPAAGHPLWDQLPPGHVHRALPGWLMQQTSRSGHA